MHRADAAFLRGRDRIRASAWIRASALALLLAWPVVRAADALPRPTSLEIQLPGMGSFGGDIAMQTLVFRPDGPGPFPVLVFSHGRATDAATRSRLTRPVAPVQVRYWLRLGFAVVAPIRVGYGATGGRDLEASGVAFDSDGGCHRLPDYGRVAEAGAKQVLAAVAWVRTQPWALPDKIVLEGQSAGGFLTVAAAAQRPPGVVGFVNFAGGTGGNPSLSPGRSCDPEQLTALFAGFGDRVAIPSAWIYAENDQFFGAEMPPRWHAAFVKGGSATVFVHAPAVADGNGHGLSSHPAELWAPYVDAFLARIGIGPPAEGSGR